MYKKSFITKDIVVPAHKLLEKKSYINKIIYNFNEKNYSDTIGYINKIISIDKISNHEIVNSDFSGSVIYRVNFTVENCNPEINDIIECKIIQSNSKIILASNEPLKIIIINEPTLPELKKDDMVNIKILCKEVNFGAKYIKVVGKFLDKLN